MKSTMIILLIQILAHSIFIGDVDLLARLISHEANNQSMEGKMAVAEVVMNRVASDQFPDDIESVIFQHNGDNYQFLPRTSLDFETQPSMECYIVAINAIYDPKGSDGSTFFINPKTANKKSLEWFTNKLEYVKTIGDHDFYKLKEE